MILLHNHLYLSYKYTMKKTVSIYFFVRIINSTQYQENSNSGGANDNRINVFSATIAAHNSSVAYCDAIVPRRDQRWITSFTGTFAIFNPARR